MDKSTKKMEKIFLIYGKRDNFCGKVRFSLTNSSKSITLLWYTAKNYPFAFACLFAEKWVSFSAEQTPFYEVPIIYFMIL